MTSNYEKLLQYLEALKIIDTHEHLVCERDRLNRDVDILTLLHLYEYVDMTSAGYQPREGENVFVNNRCLDTSVPLEDRWALFEPYLQNIKYGSYYRPLKIALKDIYGIDDLNHNTYMEATDRIRAANRKGLYKSILRDRCLIETSLVQNGCIDDQDPADIFTPLFASVNTYDYSSLDFVNMLSERNNVQISDYQTYLDLLGNYMIGCKQNGTVGFKIAAGQYVEPDMEKACQSFGEVLNGAKPEKELIGTTLDYIFEKCVELDWPVAVHCGIWWDYRTVDSKPMIDIVTRYPEVRFDLYHLGMPFVRDTIFIAKNFPNAYLNLCWTYIISQSITEQAIQEIIDTVPVNKIFAFGGDSCWSVESVYGHLKMARQTLAKALSERVENELLDLDGARHILKLWMYDNPVAFYRL
jgi:hypothetical protein